MAALPEAPKFLEHLITRGTSTPVAREYVRLVSRLRREGRLGDTARIVQRTYLTAANAYWSWVAVAYEARVTPVTRTFADDLVRKGLRWLRVHSLVGVYPGKAVPRLTRFPAAELDAETLDVHTAPAEVAWLPCDKITLHVPRGPVAVHTDPCADCAVIELDTAEKLEALAAAFEDAWGHRDLSRVPAECYLFGQPPRVDNVEAEKPAEPSGRIVALVPPGALADSLEALGGSVTRQTETFMTRASEQPPDTVVISRACADVDGLIDALETMVQVWRPKA